jgi:hypothetical protein
MAQNSGKVLSSRPSEGGSCSSETKHDIRTAPRPGLLFRRGDYRNKGHNPETLSWVRVPMKIFSVARELSTTEEKKVFISARRLQELRSQNQETFLGSSLGEDVWFRNENNLSMIFYDTSRTSRPMVSFRAIQIDKNSKHLSNFLAATLRAL